MKAIHSRARSTSSSFENLRRRASVARFKRSCLDALFGGRNKESVVVVVVVLLKKTKNIFLSRSHLSSLIKLFSPLFFLEHAKKKKNATDRRFFEFALFLKSH